MPATLNLPAQAKLILVIRAVRVFCDSFLALMIPIYLAARGFDSVIVGAVASCMLLGSAFTIGLAGAFVHRVGVQAVLCLASLSMVLSGVGWSMNATLPTLMLIAFFGSLNPHGGEVNLFRPMEHVALAELIQGTAQRTVFGYYSFIGAVAGAIGALAIGALPLLSATLGEGEASTLVFLCYALLVSGVFLSYSRMKLARAEAIPAPPVRLGASRRRSAEWSPSSASMRSAAALSSTRSSSSGSSSGSTPRSRRAAPSSSSQERWPLQPSSSPLRSVAGSDSSARCLSAMSPPASC
ncbi:hypothetical protein [Aureimonas populi]|uniref:Major facilitator superfamily (MFS) profile domain-containing protein n=1 Tax=Aureimonas populi TaxID=1701758 RepID=A0ABW5CNC1_9HYPH|nr:hypothetical protein [Aureimonas populi]